MLRDESPETSWPCSTRAKRKADPGAPPRWARAYPLIVVADSAGTLRYSRLGVLAEGSPGVDSVLAAVTSLAPVEEALAGRF